MKYGVTAATGKFGQIAVNELAKKVGAQNIIAIVRNVDKAKKVLPAAIEIRHADYGDAQSVEKAMTGVNKLLFISSLPGGPISRSQQHRNIVSAAEKANVDFIVYTSFPHATTAKSALAQDHQLTEKLIIESKINHSFVRNNWYLENDLDFIKAAANGATAYYWANNHAGWAAEKDYALGAVNVLLMSNPNDVYEFAGKARTYEELGALVNKQYKKEAPIKQLTKEQYTNYLEQNNLPHDIAEMVSSFQDPINDGSLNENTDDLAAVLGGLTPLDKEISTTLNGK